MGGEKKVFANGDTRNSSPKHANSPGSSIKKKNGKVGQRSKWAIEGIQVDIKYTKRCSASLIIREM